MLGQKWFVVFSCMFMLLTAWTVLAEAKAQEGHAEVAPGVDESIPEAREGFTIKKEYITDHKIPAYVLCSEKHESSKKRRNAHEENHKNGSEHLRCRACLIRMWMWQAFCKGDGVDRSPNSGAL